MVDEVKKHDDAKRRLH